MKLIELSEIISGYYFRSSMDNFDGGNIRLIQPGDLDNFNLENLKPIDAPSTELKRGDILLSNRGKLRAMVLQIDGSFVFPSSIYAIRLVSKNFNPEFVSAYINSESGQTQLISLSSGSYISNLTKSALENFELPYISLELQMKIAEIDSIIAKYRLATARKADLLELIKSSYIKELK
jgi:restriction endonuclease S subunit